MPLGDLFCKKLLLKGAHFFIADESSQVQAVQRRHKAILVSVARFRWRMVPERFCFPRYVCLAGFMLPDNPYLLITFWKSSPLQATNFSSQISLLLFQGLMQLYLEKWS
jgi:hypothetical protein